MLETVYHFVIILFLEFDFVILTSHIILQTNLNFVIVPTLEYDRFNYYKLLFYK
ncbi:hypothetical protein LEP1GSC075_1459 [Leptospira interrogans str. Kito]|nr:hypothetical protein LIL_20042 [Leptospira interrogans serovar Linhai str. 56609]EKO68080.1 hypothetical protein LEP1GSC069_1806 [Leptospira interrogans serovar Canicola str. Fiocruz LV133]EMK17290.1 hypothetical protein LEP1GSC075_1459 [Leptospira interrogans str. Kito]EMN74776.1 hypothetical protein LEP1GSC102_0145 [Leptospira interrogans str. UI 09600]EMN98151.1 hypothetical protein LEP1GSC112_1685 [Leptospira interrogans serovar Pomona str. UT364]